MKTHKNPAAIEIIKNMNSKWFFVLVLFLGLQVAGQAIYYFVGGDTYQSSSRRDFLVVLQLVFGLAVAFYGWKKFRLVNNSNLKEKSYE